MTITLEPHVGCFGVVVDQICYFFSGMSALSEIVNNPYVRSIKVS